ncbi:hypothetical protein BO83DRAFT_376834 [Aspergillus eucalypticola CBS 122712]|uniref:Uncharacterized protein n=1 Tax=Aspergillus eucalypticola (strain CBS 122712 / IBT 29274) TaxID=1448314 RepID=A0A317VU25_ASPEC|nr:uncharacterized protein BO83DRAFT_376834 [Aspergillus eucalypticola CBS 122712]PWY77836.1 hypothetical protein BO83DRAFT_376834 [Aspergillus eucalypticola CBS 122712]
MFWSRTSWVDCPSPRRVVAFRLIVGIQLVDHALYIVVTTGSSVQMWHVPRFQ